jgi:regulator of protease activity HflC (stomatin/prohibitin superfamily)
MQAQITAERGKRARIAESEGRKMEQINLATGAREAAIQESEGRRQAAINQAQGQAESLRLVADATAEALTRVGAAIGQEGGMAAVNLKVAEQYVSAFSQLAKESNTVIMPANVSDLGGLIASAMSIVKATNR